MLTINYEYPYKEIPANHDLAISTYNVQHSFFPNKGDLFIFPALTTHYVTPFKSEGTRISISGNISIVR